MRLGIREIDEVEVVDIHGGDKLAHRLHLLALCRIKRKASLLRGQLHKEERLEEAGASTIPIAHALLATTVIGLALEESAQTLLDALKGSLAFVIKAICLIL